MLGLAARWLFIAAFASMLGALAMLFQSRVTPKDEDARGFKQLIVPFVWVSGLTLAGGVICLLIWIFLGGLSLAD